MTVALGLVAGLILLLGGGYLMVRGASGIAARFNVPPVIVGLTIVAFGTSAPELFIGIFAAIRDQSDIVFGNAIGSNIANLGLVLGLAALISPLEIHGQIVRRELPLLLLATSVILVMALDPQLRGSPGMLDRSDGIVLLFLFLIFVYIMTQDILHQRPDDSLLAEIDHSLRVSADTSSLLNWLFVVLGIGGLVWGGDLTIDNGAELASLMNVPTAIVGLFVVAIGTSLPELVTSIIAALRRESDLAIGNVIGSNLFNGLAVLPVSAIIRPVSAPEGSTLDLLVSLVFAAILIPIFWIGRARCLSRIMGGLFLAGYAAYAFVRIA